MRRRGRRTSWRRSCGSMSSRRWTTPSAQSLKISSIGAGPNSGTKSTALTLPASGVAGSLPGVLFAGVGDFDDVDWFVEALGGLLPFAGVESGDGADGDVG